jgi:hypothetical protein
MYQRGKIYKITSDLTDKIYIGSTCNPLYKRLSQHKCSTNKCNSSELIKLGDAIITLIEDFPCERKEQLTARERYYIELNKNIVVNKFIPTRTRKEYYEDNKEKVVDYKKQYYEANKEKMAEINKQSYEANKEKVLETVRKYRETNREKVLEGCIKSGKKYREANKEKVLENHRQYNEANKVPILCICGASITKLSKTRHEKTKKHLEYIKSISLPQL